MSGQRFTLGKNVVYSTRPIVCRKGLSVAVTMVSLALSLLMITVATSDAAEDAKGIYLPGFLASMSGVMPPPGTYVTSYKYFYSGSASGAAADSVALNQLGNITLEADMSLDAKLFAEIPVVLWVAPRKILGGNFGLGGYVPIGWQDISIDVDALATLTTRNGRTFQRGSRFSLGEESIEIGDPALMPMLGWHSGNWHWNMTGLLNIPVGQYDKNDIANMGVNRWAFDATGAATWMDPQRGHEVSVAAGFTFNGENPDTKYRTGTEFHAEFAIMQHVSEAFAFGIAGYHYQQVTGDSGAGATLGAFKGRVTALGPNVVYNLKLGATPVATQLRWYHEFNVKNRVQGDAVLFSASIALGGKQ